MVIRGELGLHKWQEEEKDTQVEGLNCRGPEVESDVVGWLQQSEGKKVSRQVGQESRASGHGRLWGGSQEEYKSTSNSSWAQDTPPFHNHMHSTLAFHTHARSTRLMLSCLGLGYPRSKLLGGLQQPGKEMLGLASERPAVVS